MSKTTQHPVPPSYRIEKLQESISTHWWPVVMTVPEKGQGTAYTRKSGLPVMKGLIRYSRKKADCLVVTMGLNNAILVGRVLQSGAKNISQAFAVALALVTIDSKEVIETASVLLCDSLELLPTMNLEDDSNFVLLFQLVEKISDANLIDGILETSRTLHRDQVTQANQEIA